MTLTTTATAGGLAGDVRVGIYLRRSTDDEHQPYSIEAQDARLAAYISSQPGWRQAARFADDASGATTARPGLHRALAAARAGVIDVLLVYRVDRLTRSLRDLVTLLDDLDQAGVRFRSATEPFDTATAIGRMLVQMLGMFAQFERDTIIDRVIAGMERKAAAGKWKGGRRPFGYRADAAASTLVPDPGEAAVVRLTFDTYIRDRLGARTIANLLNDRGHRTTTGGRWSAHQVLRVLSNRIYLGELTFRGITCAGCHPPVVEQTTFDEAQRILAARGEDHAKRAASGSDYILTGLIRCPACGKRHARHPRPRPKTRIYRYYSCYRRTRYNSTACGGQRGSTPTPSKMPSSAHWPVSTAHQHDLIAEAITKGAGAATRPMQDGRRGELAATDHELAKTGAAIDRYLAAFENGTLDPEDLADRLAQLKARSGQLRRPPGRTRRPARRGTHGPPAATLREVADHIDDRSSPPAATASARHSSRPWSPRSRSLGPAGSFPVFRIPQRPAANQQQVPVTRQSHNARPPKIRFVQ